MQTIPQTYTANPLQQCGWLDFQVMHDARGNLSVIENFKHIPFNIERIYYLYDIPALAERAGHAHRNLMQVFISMSGSFDLHLDDGLMVSHASLPTLLRLEDRIRVYFSACDADLRGRIFYADLEPTFPFRVMDISRTPVLDIGPAGAFDSDGVNPSQIVERDGKLFLYYIGWQRISDEIPYTLLGGLAVSTDGGASFTRVRDTPMLAPTEDEPFFRTAPFVWWDEEQWQMLYVGGGEFFTGPSGKRLPRYALRHTQSRDGWNWTLHRGFS